MVACRDVVDGVKRRGGVINTGELRYGRAGRAEGDMEEEVEMALAVYMGSCRGGRLDHLEVAAGTLGAGHRYGDDDVAAVDHRRPHREGGVALEGRDVHLRLHRGTAGQPDDAE